MKEMDDTMALIFGYGKYGYHGKGVAMIELNKVFVEVTRCVSLRFGQLELTFEVVEEI